MKNSDIDILDSFLSGEKTADSFEELRTDNLFFFKENSFNSDPLNFNNKDQKSKNEFEVYKNE